MESTQLAQKEIVLTKEENELFEDIRKIIERSGCQSTLRVVGGWIRDKLLDLQSDDVDLMVDNMAGEAFASIMRDHESDIISERLKELNPNASIPATVYSKRVKVIKSNPEQHKHLPTATITFRGFKLEIVSIRSLTYVQESNETNDTFQNATSEQKLLDDALGRDFTINSLYYNINTQKIEDPTQQGFKDLTDGIINTPQDANVTLNQDPLRCFRAIRFATKFNKVFFLSSSIQKVVKCQKMIETLNHTIKRERIWTELTKMWKGPHPFSAARFILDLDLHLTAFCPTTLRVSDWWQPSVTRASSQNIELIEKMLLLDNPMILLVELRIMIICSILMPLCSITSNQKLPITKYQMINFWMWNKQDVNVVWLFLKSMKRLQKLMEVHSTTGLIERLPIGLLLRELGSQWIHVKQLAIVDSVTLAYNDKSSDLWKLVEAQKMKYVQFEQSLVQMGILGENPVWMLQPFYKGAEISNITGIPPGPGLGIVVSRLLEWQIEHPEKSKAECLSWLQSIDKST